MKNKYSKIITGIGLLMAMAVVYTVNFDTQNLSNNKSSNVHLSNIIALQQANAEHPHGICCALVSNAVCYTIHDGGYPRDVLGWFNGGGC
ncbi:hypothetical protein [Salegentibacter sp. Hel_I_6]|uniref:hypothetical protein n=1 Tax=Salegentibacter sp. Hel_I_6 TaxID=1250278 RepID=UPI00056A00F9|nr:hypothetical protein [Salegentibacter sp. Hel_I_6]